MKVTIKNQFYPSLIDMGKCAEILHNGLIEHSTQFLTEEEDINLKILLRTYSKNFNQHKKDVVDGAIAETDTLDCSMRAYQIV